MIFCSLYPSLMTDRCHRESDGSGLALRGVARLDRRRSGRQRLFAYALQPAESIWVKQREMNEF
jgi:hypothetical protein